MNNVIIEKELKFINWTEDLIVSLVKKYAESKGKDLYVVNESKIRAFVERAFQGERDFLIRDTLTYQGLYLIDEDAS